MTSSNLPPGSTTDKEISRVSLQPVPVETPVIPPQDNEKAKIKEGSESDDQVLIMNPKPEDRATSFFAQPGILAGKPPPLPLPPPHCVLTRISLCFQPSSGAPSWDCCVRSWW